MRQELIVGVVSKVLVEAVDVGNELSSSPLEFSKDVTEEMAMLFSAPQGPRPPTFTTFSLRPLHSNCTSSSCKLSGGRGSIGVVNP